MDKLKPTEEIRQRSLPPKEQRSMRPADTIHLPIVRNHRRWLARDIDRMLTRSWDPSLSKDELQALNDAINEAVRRRAEWDQRLVELGGVLEDVVGGVGVGGVGYHYYGRAKELQSDEQHAAPLEQNKRRHGILYQMVNAEYYGFHNNHHTKPVKTEGIDVPSRNEVEAAILRAKKAALLAKLG